MSHKSLLSLSLLLVVTCKGYDSYDYLDGKFITKDTSPVDLLAPTDKSTSSKSPRFVWTKRSGAGKYLLEVSTSSNFGTTVLSKTLTDSTYTLVNSDLSGVTILDASSYYWRVTAIYADQQVVSLSAVFHVLDDAVIYVNSSSTMVDQLGNKSATFKKIQPAIEFADTRRNGVTTVTMNIQVAAGVYNDEIQLRPGISLRGGYASSDWTRNIGTNITTISSLTDVSIRGNSAITAADTSTTVIEGFTILTGANGNPAYAISLSMASPTITKNQITVGAYNGSTTLISVVSGSPLITENTISTGTASISPTTGISISHALATTVSPIISNNTISASTANYGDGISINSTGGSNLNATISDNHISGGAGSGLNSKGIGMTFGSASIIIRNNVISGGSNSSTSIGIGLSGASPTISNNTINGGGSGNSYGLHLSGASQPIITNNIIYSTSSTGSRACIYEAVVSADPRSFQNNLLFDCPTALYIDESVNNRVLEADLNNVGNTTQSGAASGNIAPPTIANFAAIFFQSASDLHLTASTPAAVRTGGKDASQNTCGSTGTSSCGNVLLDRDGVTRTVPYSIGAYERD